MSDKCFEDYELLCDVLLLLTVYRIVWTSHLTLSLFLDFIWMLNSMYTCITLRCFLSYYMALYLAKVLTPVNYSPALPYVQYVHQNDNRESTWP